MYNNGNPTWILKKRIMIKNAYYFKKSMLLTKVYTPLLFLVMLFGLHSCTLSGNLELKSGFTIYVNDTTSVPIKNSIDILQRDIEKVLGKKAHIVTKIDDLEGLENALIIVHGDSPDLALPKLTGYERHKLYPHKGNLVIQGADLRGTLYAIYTFSEKFLGVKPLWYWSFLEPTKKESIKISDSFVFDSGEPYVKFRAWFPNDRDMILPWLKESKVKNEIWMETMLRLKLNTIELDNCTNFSSSKKYAVTNNTKIINRYGLKITFHHTSALNSPYNKWDDYWVKIRKMKAPELLIKNVSQLEDYWRYNVKSLVDNGINPLWTITFRGARDIPFWYSFKDAPESMEERAKIINEMVTRQVQILKEETGNEYPDVRMIFYDELSDLLAEGLLVPPNEKNLIWNFVAARRDHFPNKDIRAIPISKTTKLGYYMNLQFTSTGSHLAQAEGPWKMEKNYRFLDSKNEEPFYFSVVNAGNIKEHLLTLSANADMMWNFNTYDSDQFLNNFCSNYYGEKYAKSIANLYTDFFYSYWRQKKNDLPEFERQYNFHDLRYKQAILQISDKFFEEVNMNPLEDYSWEQLPNRTFRIVPKDSNTKTQIEAILKGTNKSYRDFRKVALAADSTYQVLNNANKVFFNDNLRSPSYFMMYLNEALYNYCLAYTTKPVTEKEGYLKKSLNAAKNARKSIYQTAHGKFETWYSEERIFDIDDMINRIDETIKKTHALK